MRIVKLAMAVTMCGVIGTGSAFSAPISVSSVTASSTFSTYDVINLINGNGLTGDLHSGDFKGKWITNGTPTGSLIFDLGGVYDVYSTSVWNYGPGCCGDDRSVQDLVVKSSVDGVAYLTVGSFALNQPQPDPFAAETLALNTAARYFEFDLNSNYGARIYIGLSEVQFNGSPVPVPAAAWLLGSGLLGLLGMAGRKTA